MSVVLVRGVYPNGNELSNAAYMTQLFMFKRLSLSSSFDILRNNFESRIWCVT